MNDVSTNDWVEKGILWLDHIEVNAKSRNELSWKALCQATGKSKSTLWRNKVILTKFNELKASFTSETSPLKRNSVRRNKDQQIRKLQYEVKELQRRNDFLYANLIKIIEGLEDISVDSVQFLKERDIQF